MAVNLPGILREDTHFYKEYEEQLKPYLGRQYMSYSTAGSFTDYLSDFVKSKLVGIRQPGSVYTDLGGFVGTALQFQQWPEENPHNFVKELDLTKFNVPNAEYERLIIIDRGEYILIGFIDQFVKYEDGVGIFDFKTGALNKRDQYTKEDYTQVILYAYAEELRGNKVVQTGVHFIERQNSHIKPPLIITNNVEYIPLEYSKERVEYALKKLDKAVEGITKLKNTYDKVFK